jgi:prevent-host-death family protein
MKSISLRDAKARLSTLVQAAERGEETLVTKHGKPAAKIVPVEASEQAKPEGKPTFAQLLMSIPHDIPIKRSRSRVRSIKF